jgi:hypothetical protein
VSSLRLDSLRLCWLETFVMVVDQENISAAAEQLGISQPMASRNMQALEKWLGKKLIEPGKIHDPQNPRISIGVTDDGRAFYDVSIGILQMLKDARSEAAVRNWLVEDYTKMVKVMSNGLRKLRNPEKWQLFTDRVSDFESNLESVSTIQNVEALKAAHAIVRTYFKRYEKDIRKETKPLKRATPPPNVSDEWFDAQRARRQPT